MKRLILLVALVIAMAVLAPAAFADDTDVDTEGGDTAVEMEEEKELSAAQQWKAAMIADYFGSFLPEESADAETVATEAAEDLDSRLLPGVLELRAETGWGALFKVMMYAQATGEDPWSIGPLADDGGYGFGNLFKDVEFDGEYTNLGQLQKSYKDEPGKPEKDMPVQAQKDKKDKKEG